MQSKQVVYIYDGNLPKSGKTVIEFNGVKLVHRSVAKDKGDILVDLETKAIIRAYPKKTDRSKVLNDLAKNFNKLTYFISHPQEFSLEERPKIQPKKDNDADVVYNTFKEPSYSTSGSYNHLNKGSKKTYNQKEYQW